MKLPIKRRYFDMIEKETKDMEYRDAHITFVCEKTGKTLRREVETVDIVNINDIPKKYRHLFKDKNIIRFWLKKEQSSEVRWDGWKR